MAFYTSAIATKVVNASHDQSKLRSEYKLESNSLYLSNMRLLNVGATADSESVGDERRYNHLTGCHSVIKNIYLLDGKVELDKVINYQDYAGFKAYNKSNTRNCDIQKQLWHNGMGFILDRDLTQNPTSEVALISEFNPLANNEPKLDDETPTGFLELNEVFPLLKNLQYLHTGLFQNLRVVIEYNVAETLSTEASTNGKITGTTQPILVVDQINDESLYMQVQENFGGVVWNAIESESIIIPKATAKNLAGGFQTTKNKLSGFNNKTLTNLLCQKSPTIANPLSITSGSQTCRGEEWQVSVNNSNILPNTSLVGPNARLGLLSDTFGLCNAHTCINDMGVLDLKSVFNADSVQRIGSLDYFGMTINQKINNLQITYKRKTVNPTNYSPIYNELLTLNFFGSVLKSIVPTKEGGYQVLYI